ncbi:hypothetical protein [Pseudomonas phage vB_PsaM_M1]|nr:hypothetical protein [Pseudomonas phage vB_PsaM_M1]
MSFEIRVYLDNGVVYSYNVSSQESAREHSHAIAQTGYRHVGNGEFTHYPTHRIIKVKVVGEISTNFPDKVEGT